MAAEQESGKRGTASIEGLVIEQAAAEARRVHAFLQTSPHSSLSSSLSSLSSSSAAAADDAPAPAVRSVLLVTSEAQVCRSSSTRHTQRLENTFYNKRARSIETEHISLISSTRHTQRLLYMPHEMLIARDV